MPASMIERVARALASVDNGAPTTWKLYADDARAVIKAMRTPTESMEKAFTESALATSVANQGGWPRYARSQWRAMIDAALDEA